MSEETTQEETVNPQQEQVQEEAQVQNEQQVEEAQKEEQMVPLSALQKERKKRQEIEYRLQWEAEQRNKQPAEEYEDPYEQEEKQKLQAMETRIFQKLNETSWERDNPDKVEIINEKLPEFLKRKPHFIEALNRSPNRYEDAWMMMEGHIEAPRRKSMPPPPPTPQSPAAVSKAAAMNQAMDVMKMSDKEFNEWRKSKRVRG